MNFKLWLEATAGNVLTIPLNRLYGWMPKVEEVYDDIKAGKLSYSPGVPARVSRLDNPRGAFFIIDGYHRIVEAGIKGAASISATLDEYTPRIERTGGSHRDMVNNKVPILAVIKKLTSQVA